MFTRRGDELKTSNAYRPLGGNLCLWSQNLDKNFAADKSERYESEHTASLSLPGEAKPTSASGDLSRARAPIPLTRE